MTKDPAVITASVFQPVELRALCRFTSACGFDPGDTLAVDDEGRVYRIMENGNAFGGGPLDCAESPTATKPRQRVEYTTDDLANQRESILDYLQQRAGAPVKQADLAIAMVDRPGFERAVSPRAVANAVEQQCFSLSENHEIKRVIERRRWYVRLATKEVSE